MKHTHRFQLPTLLLLAALATGCGDRPNHPPPSERSIPAAAIAAGSADPERLLPLTGAHNVRDLGGYTTADGQRVKWGQLYRADALSKLDDADLDYLTRLGLRRVVDFRSESEQQDAPDRLPTDAEYRSHPMTASTVGGIDVYALFRDPKRLNATDTGELMRDINRQLVTDYTPKYRTWLHQLATDDSASPQMFHCTAGKDRTGFAAAILLSALGVPREQIMADYLLSATYIANHNERRIRRIQLLSLWRIRAEALRPMMTVQSSFLQAAFDEAERRYGSFDDYLSEGLGVNAVLRKQLRARFLEATPRGGRGELSVGSLR